MDSKYIKAALFSFLRFKKRYPYVVSEAGGWNADVLSIYNNKMTEYEIKTSFADFKADFNKDKHKYISGAYTKQIPSEKVPEWVPHEFYFAVSPEILDRVLAFLVNKPEYGVMVISLAPNTWKLREAVSVVKKAPRLHIKSLHDGVYKKILYRMSSEIAAFHIKNLKES